jgi:citrate lyase subunit beta/citryl-CoA lyase
MTAAAPPGSAPAGSAANSPAAGYGPAWLFCPADRPDRYETACAAADVVILDLEDAVGPDRKEMARAAVAASRLDPDTTVVRVNPAGAGQNLDLAAVRQAGYHTVMLAKSETPAQIWALAPLRVVALAETPRGVLAAPHLAEQPNTIGMMWGAEDLVAAIGGRSSRRPDGSYRDVARHARSAVLLAAAACGRFALDAVHLDLGDLDGLAAEVEDAAATGFSGTACIHPAQVPVVRAGFLPAEVDVAWARAVLAAAAVHQGVFSFEGRMVDAPVLRHAASILQRVPC